MSDQELLSLLARAGLVDRHSDRLARRHHLKWARKVLGAGPHTAEEALAKLQPPRPLAGTRGERVGLRWLEGHKQVGGMRA